jgi:squalene-hopene/tetraprenyl-beta-curcumene cyclase
MTSLRRYLANNRPQNLHHEAMLLWASQYHKDLISDEDKQETIDRLWQLQKDDGGWALATMGHWKRHDGGEQETANSDGYGTGLAIFVLRQAEIPAGDSRIQRGVDWLKSHQRASGRWFTRSLYRDNKHFLTHAGTAFAIMALAECDALNGVAAVEPGAATSE